MHGGRSTNGLAGSACCCRFDRRDNVVGWVDMGWNVTLLQGDDCRV